eukprot:UN14630
MFVPYEAIRSPIVQAIRFINPSWWSLQCGLSIIHHDLPSDFEYGCVENDECIYDDIPELAQAYLLDQYNDCSECLILITLLTCFHR